MDVHIHLSKRPCVTLYTEHSFGPNEKGEALYTEHPFGPELGGEGLNVIDIVSIHQDIALQ